MKKLFTFLLLLSVATISFAQRVTDKLDRAVVAIPGQSGGIFVSWRRFGEEYYDVTYNLYCNGKKIASNLKVSNYEHSSGTTSSMYSVAPVVRGVEQAQCAQVGVWADGYKLVNLIEPVDRNGNAAGSYYSVNDISLGDLNGDGLSEFIIKRPCSDASDPSQSVRFHHIDVYDINGNRLWWIDMGPNMLAGADEQWDAVAYDWDGDGKAEVLLRGEDNMYIHHADGTTTKIGDNTDTRWSGIEYTSTGNEYLLYLDGETGKPYQIGPSSHPNYMDYPLPRGVDSDWGTGIVGHRSTKHYFGAPFLDGRHASIFLGRGCYTKHHMKTFDVDPSTHKLSLRWEWKSDGLSGTWFGQGYHNYAIGDVDWDGRDEIIFGSMVIDDNGKGLSTTGLGHGDAQHCSDFDPYRKYEEQFACNEDSPAMNYRNAVTSQIYYRVVAGADDGRALMGNFTNDYPGSTGRSVNSGWVSSCADKEIQGLDLIAWSDLNARIYWDGDLCDEYMDSPGTEKQTVVYKPGGGRLVYCSGSCINYTKNNASAIGDIYGDWREELVLRNGDNAFVVQTTNYPTTYAIPTLWSDHQYRNAMVWQSMGYNQPPHKSYFLGEMEGITQAPPTNTMTDRTEISNGGTIGSSVNDKHIIVCEMNDTKINVTDGAAPYIATFNIPSHVEGNNDNNSIQYSYSTCNVTGGAFTGSMRLVKQGDGILNLPKVDEQYTGETNIWAGTLNFDGTMKKSEVWLNRFAELNSDGGEFKSLKADYGSIIRPGGADKAGTITVDSIYSMGFGSRLVLDLYSDGLKADQIIAPTLKIEKKTSSVWQQYGPEYIQPVIEIVEHMADGATTLAAGNYIIGKVDKVTGLLANIKIEGVTNLKSGLSVDENNNLILTLGNVRGASNIVWTGNKSNIWDFAKTENFYVADDTTKTADYFVKGDIVNFTDDASKYAVSLEDDVQADTIYFNSSKNYTLSGTGSITDNSALVKDGTGSLTISVESSYTGGNYLKGGTTIVSSLANANKAEGNLGAVTTSASKFTMENGAELKNSATVTNASPIKMIGTQGGVINTDGGSFTQNAAISGTLLTKKGSGWYIPTVASTVTKMIVEAGTVNASEKPANNIEVRNSAALTGSGFLTTPIKVADGAKASLTTVNRATTALTLSGNGQITIYCASEKGSNYYATRTPLNLTMTAFKGTIVAEATYAADGRFTLSTSSGNAFWILNIPASHYVQNSGKTLRIGQVTGDGSLGGYSSFSNSGSASANTWQVGNDSTDFTFNGVVTSIDNFTKMGKCKMTTKGAWDLTGSVAVNAGELHVSTGGVLGTGALTVSNNAILSGIGNLTNSAYTVNGTIQPGMLAGSYSGTMDMGGKDVKINNTGVYQTTARKCATKSNNGCAYLSNIGKLTLNGTIKVNLSSNTTLTVGDSIKIFEANSFTGTPKYSLPSQFHWDKSRISEGLLFVKGYSEDVNEDGTVDSQDVLKVYEYMKTATGSVTSDTLEDVNGDGTVDSQDILKIYEYMKAN